MKAKTLKTESLKSLIDKLIEKGIRVIAPTRVEGLVLFDDVDSSSDVTFDYIITDRPVKEYFFPRTERLLAFDLNDKGVQVKNPELNVKKTVIVGTRPCDAVSLPILDHVFSSEYKDDLYHKRREGTTIISIACTQSDESCFCTSVEYSPDSSEGSDILLMNGTNGNYFVDVVTEKGDKLIAEVGTLFRDVQEGDEPEENGKFPAVKFSLKKIKPWLDDNFENDFWDRVSLKCLGCSSCRYLCPTCHCFDIQDEATCDCGERIRNWDSCSYGIFTLHASGHNPRPHQTARNRQRIMHKYKYYVDNFKVGACVGCGRCLRSCPVNLDIVEILSEMDNGGMTS